MKDDVNERFERLEDIVRRIGEGHIELEAAQRNTERALTRFIDESNTRGAEVNERIKDLTVLVDQLIKRDLNGNGH
jgi:exonuclease VII small subunit